MRTHPDTSYLRLNQIIGQQAISPEQAEANKRAHADALARGAKPGRHPQRPRPSITPILPISSTAFWELVNQGIVPKPIKVGSTSLWLAADIAALTPDVLARAKPQQRTPREQMGRA